MSSRGLAVVLGLALVAAGARGAGPDHSLFSAILGDHVREGLVDYRALAGDRRLDVYLEELSRTDPGEITDGRERLAFWLNAYNAFTLKLIVTHLPLESIRDISVDGKGPWDIPFVGIAGRRLTLNQIEHEIIRPEFQEPRVHMALVCAAFSCPPLREEAYHGPELEAQLEDNTRRFLADSTKNRYDASTGTLELSEIFSWFGGDFHPRYGSVEKFVRKYLPLGEQRETGGPLSSL